MWDLLYHKDYYTGIMDYIINLKNFNISRDLKPFLIHAEYDCLYTFTFTFACKAIIANNFFVRVALFFYQLMKMTFLSNFIILIFFRI
jgi:hypothetical protein